jgi:hypothetical protein
MTSRRVGSLRQALLTMRVAAHNEVAKELRTIGIDLRAEFKDVVNDWTHRPDFEAKTTMQPHALTLNMKVRGQHKKIWGYVNDGTRPHIIMPKKPGGRLVFQLGYSPRTTPTAQAHVGTGQASGGWRKAQMVFHPGTEPRDFTITILDDFKPEFRRRIENAFRRATRR